MAERTARERAISIALDCGIKDDLEVRDLADAIEAAIIEEREACAMVAQQFSAFAVCQGIAARIRARSTEGDK
jgi:hypothetical protein